MTEQVSMETFGKETNSPSVQLPFPLHVAEFYLKILKTLGGFPMTLEPDPDKCQKVKFVHKKREFLKTLLVLLLVYFAVICE